MDRHLNGDYFIKTDLLYRDFDICRDSLALAAVNFWANFKRQEINIQFCATSMTIIADQSKRLFRIFQDLDSLKIFKDYSLYFQFAIIQIHVLNDHATYQTYINKMKSILDLNRAYQKNFT